MVAPMVIAAGVQAGLSFFGGLSSSRKKRKAKKRQAAEARRQALEAGRRLEIRLAAMNRAKNRLQGARRAAVGASGQTRSGSALEVLTDRAREDEVTVAVARLEGEQQINAILRGASVLSKQAGAINPLIDAITAGVGAAAPFSEDIASIFATPRPTTATSVLSRGAPQSGAGRIPGITGP